MQPNIITISARANIIAHKIGVVAGAFYSKAGMGIISGVAVKVVKRSAGGVLQGKTTRYMSSGVAAIGGTTNHRVFAHI